MSDSGSSTQSLQHGGMPELLLGLAYNGTTGRLSVEVIKGSNFRNMAMNRAPGTICDTKYMPNIEETLSLSTHPSGIRFIRLPQKSLELARPCQIMPFCVCICVL